MPSGSQNKSRKPNDAAEVPEVEPSCGNVFADLAIANPSIALAKAKLVQRIRVLIEVRKLTQARAAKLLGIDRPKVSALLSGRVNGYSLDRLFHFLAALGQEVEITIRPAAEESSEPIIVVA